MSNGSESRFSRFFKWGGSKGPATEATQPAAASAPVVSSPPAVSSASLSPAASGPGPSLDQVRTLKQQGKVVEALALCRQILALRPDNVEVAVLAAEILVAQGERDDAIATYSKVIELQPDQALAYYKRGNLLKDALRLEAAVLDYDRAIAIDPNYAYALCNRGVVLSRLGRAEAALESYDRAIAITPGDVVALFNRAEVLRELKRPQEALAGYERVIAVNPGNVQSYCNRGVLLTELERFAEARADFDRALSISTDIPDVYYGRGRVLHKQQQIEAALADYRRASALDPNSAVLHFAQAEALADIDRPLDALSSYDKALALQPEYPEALLRRANVLLKLRRHAEAILAYERALAAKPDSLFARGLLQHARMLICDWEGFDAGVERVLAGVREHKRVSNPFSLLSMSDDPSIHHEGARLFVEEVAPAKDDLPAMPRRVAPGKLRIGYFSCDLREHPVAMLTTELFESHDRDRFEITAFSLGPDDSSDERERLKKAFDRFVDVRHLSSDREVALLARKHDIDIAVDLCGHTVGGRMEIFARRAAPIQATWLGYAGTTGAGYFDYLIGDRTVIPPEHQPHYSEKIVYLPHCYLPNDSTRVIADRPTREQLGLPAQGFVFCSFNNSYKFTPEVFSSWARILTRVAGSVLWLAQSEPTAAKNLLREAERRGIDPRRVIFAARTSGLPEHLARLQLADLFLDTLPYNAHSTAIDALWAGLPLLTRLGGSFAGRVAASLLRAIELPELVTTSIQQYEALAVDLATNPTRLAEIKQRLAANRLATPLFDSRRFVRQLEAAYLGMYDRYSRKLAPDHIDVPAVTG